MSDDIFHPKYYTSGSLECIEAIRASMTVEAFAGYLSGNCMKYLWRYKHKFNLKRSVNSPKAEFGKEDLPL